MKHVIHGVLGIGMALGIWHAQVEHRDHLGAFVIAEDARMPFCLMRVSSPGLSISCVPTTGHVEKGHLAARFVTKSGIPLRLIASGEASA